MKPKNTKTLLTFIFDQMDKLDRGEISTETAREQANLCKQANNTMRYDLDKATVQMKLSEHNKAHGTNIKID